MKGPREELPLGRPLESIGGYGRSADAGAGGGAAVFVVNAADAVESRRWRCWGRLGVADNGCLERPRCLR